MKKAASPDKPAATPRKRKPAAPGPEQILRDALAPYISVPVLRRLAARDSAPIHSALLTDQPPPEVQAMLKVLAAVLSPVVDERISEPADVAAPLLVEMGHLLQEQLRVVCLSTKNHVQSIQTVSQGNLKARRSARLSYSARRAGATAPPSSWYTTTPPAIPRPHPKTC